MKPKLPRALLWTDLDSMNEFLMEPVNRDMYEVILKINKYSSTFLDDEVTNIFNEVYYQCTRIIYEQKPNKLLRDYIIDIKSNIGSFNNANIVYALIYFLLYHRPNNSNIVMEYCSLFYRRFAKNDKDVKRAVFEMSFPPRIYDVELSPKPCKTRLLDKMLIDWDEVTNHYDKESIDCIVNLYNEVAERKNIYSLIEKAYERFLKKQGKNILDLKKMYPNMADYQFFYDYNEVRSNGGVERPILCQEEEPPVFPTYRELEEENVGLKKKLDEALSENESLKSKLNMTKPKRQQETSFTVGKIVDYCKRIPEYKYVEAIEKMLYKFIRDCSDKEEKLIDSISEHFNNKKYGDTVMGDKNDFYGNSGLNQIALPPGMTPQEAIKLLQSKDTKKNGKESKG